MVLVADPLTIAIEIILLMFLLYGSAFFSSTEAAVISSSRIKLREKAEKGIDRARFLLTLLSKPEKVLSTLLVGNNLMNVAIAAIITDIFIRLYGDIGVGIATGVGTLLLLIFGEVIPKAYAIRDPESYAMKIVPALRIAMKILSPVAVVLASIANSFLKTLGFQSRRTLVTEDEIKLMLRVGREEGILTSDEYMMMSNVMKFMDTPVSRVMIPVGSLEMIDSRAPIKEVIEIFRKTGHSRYPIYDKDLNNVVGMIHVKDLLKDKFREDEPVIKYMRPIIKVNENSKLYDVLKLMKAKKTHFAVVVDSKTGRLLGGVTLENLLEEIVGEIYDEYD